MEYGQFCITRGIDVAMEETPAFTLEVLSSLEKYIRGDWGDICVEDWKLNQESVKYGERVLGCYNLSKGKVFIITEWDRSVTTILFADEY